MDSGFPLSRQFFLSVSVYPQVSGRRLQLNALFLDERGQLVPSTILIPTTIAGTKTETEIQCIDGYLLSVTVSDDAGSCLPGEVYCTVSIKLGQVDTNSPLATMVRGYVFEGNSIYWPGGKDKASLDSPGRLVITSGVAPGAGLSYDVTLDSYVSYNILAVNFTYTCSAVVVSRGVYIELATDSGVVHRTYPSIAVTAGQTQSINFTTTNPTRGVSPGLFIGSGLLTSLPFSGPLKAFTIDALNMDAGDTITNIRTAFEQFAYLPGF